MTRYNEYKGHRNFISKSLYIDRPCPPLYFYYYSERWSIFISSPPFYFIRFFMQTPEIIARFTQIEPINMKPGEVVFDRIVEDWNVFYLSIKCTCWNVRSYCYSENWWEYLQKARSLWDLANILYYDEHRYE